MADATIILAGLPYRVPRLNLGQHRRLAGQSVSGGAGFGFDFLALAMERADPPAPKFDEIEATHDEIVAALAALNDLNGIGNPKAAAR